MPNYDIVKYFEYDTLPSEIHSICKDFYDLAHRIDRELDHCNETEVSLRKLLESRDAVTRVCLHEEEVP